MAAMREATKLNGENLGKFDVPVYDETKEIGRPT